MDKNMENGYMELQLIDRQARQIQQQLGLFEQQIAELETLKQALSELPNVKPGSETLVPLSGGVYIRAKIEEVKDIVVNVGSGIAVSKSVKDSEAMIEEQLSELKDYQVRLMTDLNALIQRARFIEKDVSGLSGKEDV